MPAATMPRGLGGHRPAFNGCIWSGMAKNFGAKIELRMASQVLYSLGTLIAIGLEARRRAKHLRKQREWKPGEADAMCALLCQSLPTGMS